MPLAKPLLGKAFSNLVCTYFTAIRYKLVQFWQSSSTPRPYQQPSWHAYTTYNAAQMLIAAIQQSPLPDRGNLRVRLSAPGFSAKDASDAMLRFRDETGELAKPQITLTRVVLCREQLAFRTLDQPECP